MHRKQGDESDINTRVSKILDQIRFFQSGNEDEFIATQENLRRDSDPQWSLIFQKEKIKPEVKKSALSALIRPAQQKQEEEKNSMKNGGCGVKTTKV